MLLTLNQFGLNRNLSVLSATIFVNVFVRFTWDPLLPLYLRRLGANDLEIGFAFTVMTVARTLFSILGGVLADRFGRVAVLALPMFAVGALYIVASGVTDRGLFVLVLTIANVFGALQWPALAAMTAESAVNGQLARAYSWTEAAVLSGVIGGPIAGAALLGVLDIPGLMVINGGVLLVMGLIRLRGLRETAPKTHNAALLKIRAAFEPRLYWYIVMMCLQAAAFAITFGPFFAILSRDVWHLGEAEINLLFSLGSVASLIGIVAGRLTDRWGARRVVLLSAIAYSIASAAWGLAPSWEWGVIPLLIAFGFSEGVLIAQQTMQAEITNQETRSSVIGVIATISGFAGGIGPTLGAWLITLGGNAMPFLAAGAMGLLMAGAVLPIRKKVTGDM
ncbi:MAG: MFS transporter [Chloroflexi bacterium]|nr:MFS transporter [Chloroflexota bacterium]